MPYHGPSPVHSTPHMRYTRYIHPNRSVTSIYPLRIRGYNRRLPSQAASFPRLTRHTPADAVDTALATLGTPSATSLGRPRVPLRRPLHPACVRRIGYAFSSGAILTVTGLGGPANTSKPPIGGSRVPQSHRV
ncbi:unnamed protein product [Rhizoctonia solani]|uniref:Uncharacterized protein n=1 Tax=Rhizoctonia solani TaxID=456999 RepID=A0A8H3GWZ9_9AGAM|nr:unnamed protein product [Rhizoctonia solani]